MCKVSVIIPNFNHEKYLRKRIDSILNQTYQDFEIIILDDLSQDDSKKIIHLYSTNPKVSHIVYNEKNSGSTFVQWEKGLRLAKGEYIWIAESDDYASNNFLTRSIGCLDANLNNILWFCASNLIDEHDRFLGREDWSKHISERNWEKSFTRDGVSEIKDHLYFRNTIPNASAVVFRKKSVDFTIFKKIRQMKFAGDWTFWVHLLEKGFFSYEGDALNFFRMQSHSTRENKEFYLEKMRYSEIMSNVNYIRDKYNLKWDLAKHNWFLDEWYCKYREGRNIFNFYNADFPLVFNLYILKKMIKRLKAILLNI